MVINNHDHIIYEAPVKMVLYNDSLKKKLIIPASFQNTRKGEGDKWERNLIYVGQ